MLPYCILVTVTLAMVTPIEGTARRAVRPRRRGTRRRKSGERSRIFPLLGK